MFKWRAPEAIDQRGISQRIDASAVFRYFGSPNRTFEMNSANGSNMPATTVVFVTLAIDFAMR